MTLEVGKLVSGAYAAAETDKRAESANDRFEQFSERLSSTDEEDSPR